MLVVHNVAAIGVEDYGVAIAQERSLSPGRWHGYRLQLPDNPLVPYRTGPAQDFGGTSHVHRLSERQRTGASAIEKKIGPATEQANHRDSPLGQARERTEERMQFLIFVPSHRSQRVESGSAAGTRQIA